MHTDDGSGSATTTQPPPSKRQAQGGVQVLPHGVGGSALTGTGAWQQSPVQQGGAAGDGSASLGRVHVDGGSGSGSGNGS